MSIPYLVVMVTQIKVTDSGGYLKKMATQQSCPQKSAYIQSKYNRNLWPFESTALISDYFYDPRVNLSYSEVQDRVMVG